MKSYSPDKIKNIAIVGHGGCGKTSLAEALLFRSGATDRLGKIADGTTVIRDAQELKVKESDRITVMVENLKRMGADIEGTDDGMIIHGGKPLHGATIDSHLDHRVAMSFAVAGTICDGPMEILHGDCVKISYPNFYQDLYSLGDK